MKHYFGFGVVAVVALFSASAVFAASDPGGFMGLKWTQTVGDCKKKGLCSDQSLTVPDAIANEKGYYGASNKWNGIPAKFSSFAFHENRFYTATTVFDPREASFEDLKHSLTKTHGQPKTSGPKTVTWVLGQTNVALYKGETFHGVVYSHGPGFAKVAKIKNYPMVDPPRTPSAKKKK